MAKLKVALFGASGTMGYQAFQELWRRRERYDISLLVLPSEQKLGLFRSFERAAGVPRLRGKGTARGNGLKIVWGDATCYEDVVDTIRGADWVLDAMACISPAADYNPSLAKAVNIDGIHNILRAIQAEPGGAERIRFVYTGTVAETGNRPPGIHVGRVGDPLKPSVFDYYAITKIAGERAVLESPLRYWASLRMTFIMPTRYRELLKLLDPISLHMPVDAYMENLTDRDAGYGLANCLDLPEESDFWRRVYNMGGGPKMRCAAYDYLDQSFRLNGLSGIRSCTRRNWFALRNFHMQYFEDSHILNGYLHYWHDSLENYWQAIQQDMPFFMRCVRFMCRRLPAFRRFAEKITRQQLRLMAEEHRNGTAFWAASQNVHRLSAFFGSSDQYRMIPEWDGPVKLDPQPAWRRLDHGYDETKPRLECNDLEQAAAFRGGQLLSRRWDGDMYAPLAWKCAFGHSFSARPYTVLKAGHWCPECVSPVWNGDEMARRNPFFAQVWYADHDPGEDNFYPEKCMHDILGADQEWRARSSRKRKLSSSVKPRLSLNNQP